MRTNEKTGKQEHTLDKLIVHGAEYSTRLTSKYKNRPKWSGTDVKKVVSVIPGTIWKVMARDGGHVEKGDPLLILEAMKMRNEVCSPVSGVIKKIHVQEGEKVPKSHLLAEFK